LPKAADTSTLTKVSKQPSSVSKDREIDQLLGQIASWDDPPGSAVF